MNILTEEEIEVINNYLLDRGNGSRIDFARAIEAAVIANIHHCNLGWLPSARWWMPMPPAPSNDASNLTPRSADGK